MLPKRLTLIWVGMFLGFVGCAHDPILPRVEEVPEGKILPIDGEWIGFTPPLKGIKLRLDRDRLYALEPFKFNPGNVVQISSGSVIARNFRQTGPREFECDFALIDTFVVGQGEEKFVTVKAEITTSRSLAFDIPDDSTVQSQRNSFRGEHVFMRPNDGSAREMSELTSNGSDIQTSLNSDEIREEVASELIEIPAGAVFRIKRARTIDHSVELQLDTAVHGELSLDALSWLRASIKGQVEKKVAHGFKESELIEHEITLDGNRGRRYKLTWQGKFLTGAASFKQGDREESIPFRLKVSEDFSAVPIP